MLIGINGRLRVIKKRLDQMIFDLGLTPSRAKAQEIIRKGGVRVFVNQQWLTPLKPSEKYVSLLAEDIQITSEDLLKYVSRAGLKLEGALEYLGFSPENLKVLDLGISTGGFTDCLLQKGVEKVVGVDVGKNQLHSRLRHDSRVYLLEGINARRPPYENILAANGGEKFDLIVCDLSFISLTLVVKENLPLLKEQGFLLCLVKPQFELTPGSLNRKGLVKDVKKLDEVKDKVIRYFVECRLSTISYFESSIEGSDGNREFFIFAQYASPFIAGFDS